MAMLTCDLSTQRDTCRYGPPVYPKGHPGQHHHQHCRKVRLKHEEEDMPPENEIYVESIVPTWNRDEQTESGGRASRL